MNINKLLFTTILALFLANCGSSTDEALPSAIVEEVEEVEEVDEKLSINTINVSALALYQSSSNIAAAANDNANANSRKLKNKDLIKYTTAGAIEPLLNLDIQVNAFAVGEKEDDYILISANFTDKLDVDSNGVTAASVSNIDASKCILIAVNKNQDKQAGYCLDSSDEPNIYNDEVRQYIYNDNPLYAFDNAGTTNYIFFTKKNGLSEIKLWNGTKEDNSITTIYQSSNPVFAAEKFDTVYVYAKNGNYFLMVSADVAGGNVSNVLYGNSVDGWSAEEVGVYDSLNLPNKKLVQKLGDNILWLSESGSWADSFWNIYNISDNTLTQHSAALIWFKYFNVAPVDIHYSYVEVAGWTAAIDYTRAGCRSGILQNETHPIKQTSWVNADGSAIYYLNNMTKIISHFLQSDICKIDLINGLTAMHSDRVSTTLDATAYNGDYQFGVQYQNEDGTVNKVFILGEKDGVETLHTLDLITDTLDESVNILSDLDFSQVSDIFLDANDILTIAGTGGNGLLKVAYYDPETLTSVVAPQEQIITTTPVKIK